MNVDDIVSTLLLNNSNKSENQTNRRLPIPTVLSQDNHARKVIHLPAFRPRNAHIIQASQAVENT